jgi:hypothetical protein
MPNVKRSYCPERGVADGKSARQTAETANVKDAHVGHDNYYCGPAAGNDKLCSQALKSDARRAAPAFTDPVMHLRGARFP